jgi:predicted amino acid dehydrogenase
MNLDKWTCHGLNRQRSISPSHTLVAKIELQVHVKWSYVDVLSFVASANLMIAFTCMRVSCLIFCKPLPKAVEKGEKASLPKAVADFKF